MTPGTIMKIKACNFVSYRKLKCEPQSSVNILLAPNGAGKSSVLSAIILALAGKPNIIGKNNQVSEFIMYGKEEAEICVQLYDPQSDDSRLTVTRTIRRNNSSVWTLNRSRATLAQVEEAMKRLNIQVDNLCQVLPQERVHDFAKMNSIDLLENIQRVLGDSLHSDYRQLLELRTSLTTVNEALEKNTQLRQDQIVKYQRLEQDMAAIKEKKRALEAVTRCKQKLAWALYQQKHQLLLTVSAELSQAQEKLDSSERQSAPLKKSLQAADHTCLSTNQAIKNKRSRASGVKEKVTRLVSEVRGCRSEMEGIKESLRLRLADADSHDTLLSNIDTKILHLSQQLLQHNDKELTEEVSCLDREIKCKGAELQSLMHQLNLMKQEQVVINNTIRGLESRLEQANSVKRRRLQLLSSRSGDVFKAHQWLSHNRQSFHSTVHGPLLVELNITNSEGAKYVEFLIPYRDLTSFLTETSQDMTSLLRVLRDRERLAVSCAHCPPPDRPLCQLFPPPLSHQTIRELGFDCYLVDLVEGPDTVIKHLCNLCQLHRVPVAFSSRPLDTATVSRHNISAYFVGNEFYRVKTSIYSKTTSTSVVKVGPSTFLADSIDKKLIHQTQLELNAKREAVGELELEMAGSAESRSGLESELNSVRLRKKESALKLEQYRSTTVRLRMHQEERARLVASLVDTHRLQHSAQSALQEVVRRNWDKMKRMVGQCREYCELSVAVRLSELEYSHCKTLRDATKQSLTRLLDSHQHLKGEVEEARRRMVEVKAETGGLKCRAMELTKGLSPGDDNFTRCYSKSFSSLPDDVDSITAKIHSYEAKARCLHNPLHHQCIEEYEGAKALADSLGVELEKLSHKLDSVRSSLGTVRCRWLPRIQTLVSQLDTNFSAFFSKMGCVGQVTLATPTHHEDGGGGEEVIEKFGVEIRVKFRDDTDLQLLDPFVQSGGERALTTAVFLLSLQKLSCLPFRCIDEINQGMDELNERRMYSLLFNTVADASSQYFLLTPKFLKNVTFPTICTIFNIYNCPVLKAAKRSHELPHSDKENDGALKRRRDSATKCASLSGHDLPMRSHN